jgi:predicted O-methyltransferase YrrM
MSAQTSVSNADEVLRLIEKASEKDFLPIIGPLKGKFLADEVRKAMPRRVLEVGTLIGYSAILMGKEMDEFAEIITIEIHRDEADLAARNIIRAKVPPKIQIINGNALQIIPALKGPFDLPSSTLKKASISSTLSYLRISCGRARLFLRITQESSLTK